MNSGLTEATLGPTQIDDSSDRQAPRRPRAVHVTLGLIIVGYALVRLRVAALPLERDEGEFAYGGQLILRLEPLYRFAHTMKWPGTHAMYALFMAALGETPWAIRVGLILVTSLTACLIFVLVSRMSDPLSGLMAAAVQLQLSATVGALGPFAHATHFVAAFAVAGFLILRPRDTHLPGNGRLYMAGIAFGLSALMKQPGAAFAVTAAIWLATRREWSPRRRAIAAMTLTAGAATPVVLAFAAVAASGSFGDFWLWTFEYAGVYAGQLTLGAQAMMLSIVARKLALTAILLVCAAAGAVLLVTDATRRRDRGLVFALAIGGVLCAGSGFHFREQYFIASFPGIAALAGIFTAEWPRGGRRGRTVAVIALVGGIIAPLANDWRWYQLASPLTQMREVYEYNPFTEAQEVGRLIAKNAAPGDRIAVAGSEPEIYFYARRLSATGYIYVYPLVEPQPFAHAMQLDMLDEITRSKPAWLVYVNVPSSWAARPDSDPTLIRGLQKIARSYVVTGIVDLVPGGTRTVLGQKARRVPPTSRYFLLIMERRAGT